LNTQFLETAFTLEQSHENRKQDISLREKVINMNLGFAVFGGVFFLLGSLMLWSNIIMFRTKSAKIYEAEGDSIIYGEVLDKATMKSPLTGKDCVYAHYMTFQTSYSRKSKLPNISTLIPGCGSRNTNFYLRDETGEIKVTGKGMHSGKPKNKETVYDNSKKYVELVRKFKEETRIGEDREYEERIIVPGEQIYVWGKVKTIGTEKTIEARVFAYKDPKKNHFPAFIDSSDRQHHRRTCNDNIRITINRLIAKKDFYMKPAL